jgi:hypothetical protein
MSTDKRRVGARLRAERKAQGLVVAAVAREFRKLDPDLPSLRNLERTIRGHEAGEHKVSERYRLLYCEVLGKSERELFEVNEELPAIGGAVGDGAALSPLLVDVLSLAWAVGRLDQSMDRRAVLQLAAAVAGAPALAVVDPVERLASALAHPRGVSEQVMAHLEGRTIGFHRLECVLPADQVFRALLSHLSELTSLLETVQADRWRRRLARTAGESAVLGAWLAWDLGDSARAERLHNIAVMAADEANDPAIVACSEIYRSFATSAVGAHTAACRALTQAQQCVAGTADPATRAWLLGRTAEEAAALNDHSAWDMIEQASDLLASARPQTERSWTRCLQSSRFSHIRLTIATRLSNEAVVHDEIGHVLLSATDPAEKRSGRMLATVGLALTRVGDVAEGIRWGERSLEAVQTSRAAYAAARLVELDRALGDQPAADELRAGIHATCRDLASPRPSTPNTLPNPH